MGLRFAESVFFFFFSFLGTFPQSRISISTVAYSPYFPSWAYAESLKAACIQEQHSTVSGYSTVQTVSTVLYCECALQLALNLEYLEAGALPCGLPSGWA